MSTFKFKNIQNLFMYEFIQNKKNIINIVIVLSVLCFIDFFRNFLTKFHIINKQNELFSISFSNFDIIWYLFFIYYVNKTYKFIRNRDMFINYMSFPTQRDEKFIFKNLFLLLFTPLFFYIIVLLNQSIYSFFCVVSDIPFKLEIVNTFSWSFFKNMFIINIALLCSSLFFKSDYILKGILILISIIIIKFFLIVLFFLIFSDPFIINIDETTSFLSPTFNSELNCNNCLVINDISLNIFDYILIIGAYVIAYFKFKIRNT